jgi:hypothetical protein
MYRHYRLNYNVTLAIYLIFITHTVLCKYLALMTRVTVCTLSQAPDRVGEKGHCIHHVFRWNLFFMNFRERTVSLCFTLLGEFHGIVGWISHILFSTVLAPSFSWSPFSIPLVFRPGLSWTVYDEEKSLSFIIPKYLIHWAYIVPILGANKPSLTFLNDLIDRDMFLN